MASAHADTTGLRRSARLATVKGHHSPPVEGAEADDSDLETPEPPPTKRQKRSNKMYHGAGTKTLALENSAKGLGKSGKRRNLSKLPDMPLDILFEIFGHLHPLDVLHLARTTRSLRGLLMRRSAITIWKRSREQVPGLPECPSDLSEPQYANLLFEPYCHYCLSARVMNVMWSCRARCCKKCFTTNFVDLTSMFLSLPVAKLRPGAMLPCEDIKNKLYFRKSQIDELNERIKDIIGDEDKAKQMETDRIQAVAEIETHAQLLEDWQNTQNLQRALVRESVRYNRRHAIFMELTYLGYAHDLAKMSEEFVVDFMEHPLVKQPKELTPRIWNNIKDTMIDFVYKARHDRLARERCARLSVRVRLVHKIIKDFVFARSPTEYLPNTSDFCVMPEFRALLDLPEDVALDVTSFAPLIPQLPALAARWRRAICRELLKIIPSCKNGHADADVSPLELATTWFQCLSCNQVVGFPRALVHKCITRGTKCDWKCNSPDVDLRNACVTTLNEVPWSRAAGVFIFSHRISAQTRHIIEACGLDPDNATASKMDGLDARLACVRCSDDDVCVASWRLAVKHLHSSHWDYVSWTYLNSRDTSFLKHQEASRLEYDHDTVHMWLCRHCGKGPETLNSMKDHLRLDHDGFNPHEGVDYALNLDTSFPLKGPPTLRYIPVEKLTTPLPLA